MTDLLAPIVARKRLEVERRKRRGLQVRGRQSDPSRSDRALAALKRTDELRVIAEVKFRSPSAGQIRPWAPGEGIAIARQYADNGADVVSVLADAVGFGGSPSQVRRVAHAVSVPVLFKGFVIDRTQVDLAYLTGASLVLLLVRLLDDATLEALIDATIARGMQPVVEAADAHEMVRALDTQAKVVGINARDLRTFSVDTERAADVLQSVPPDRIAVFMSGIKTTADLSRVGDTRADAVLIGEALMRADEPGRALAAMRLS